MTHTGHAPTAINVVRFSPDPVPPSAEHHTPVMDNRSSYLGWGLAWLVGHGAYALSGGSDPLVPMPEALPLALLVTGLTTAVIVTVRAIARGQRGVTGPAKAAGTLLGAGWLIGFVALFLLITALTGATGEPHLQALLWPTGTGLVVGMMYLWGGTLQHDRLQYALGGWLALTATAALFLGLPGMYWVLAVVGGGGYLVAAALEPRRRAVAEAR